MPLDPSISLQTKPPSLQSSLEPLNTLVSMSRQALALRQAQDTYGANVARTLADTRAAEAGADVAEATVKPKIAEQTARTSVAQTEATKAGYNLTNEQVGKGLEDVAGTLQDPRVTGDNANTDGTTAALLEAKKRAITSGMPEVKAEQAFAPLVSAAAQPGANGEKTAVPQMLRNIIRAHAGYGTQASVINNPVSVLNTGAALVPVQTQPAAEGGLQPVQPATLNAAPKDTLPPGTIAAQPPPTTEVLGPNKERGIVGALQPPTGGALETALTKSPGEYDVKYQLPDGRMLIGKVQGASSGASPVASAAPATPSPQSGFMPTSLPPGQDTAIKSGVDQALKHYQGLSDSAQGSGTLEGIAKNIVAGAPKAINGTGAEKLQFWNGLAAQAGWKTSNDLKTVTDEVQKNMAQLQQQQPAGSVAAINLNDMASPHPTMTVEAQVDAAKQMIGRFRMAKDLSANFTPDVNKVIATGNPSPYLEKQAAIAQHADPRIWQMEQMSPAELAAYKTKIGAAQFQELSAHAKALHDQFGLFQ